MIINGKNFIPPPGDDRDFKDLFRNMVALGAGRPVDDDGFPEGSWTAQSLTDEICMLDANSTGVDLRTVQLWFQDNVKGISASNIRWLARIFGCGDPEATSRWQAELSAAQARLVAGRRNRRKSPDVEPPTGSMQSSMEEHDSAARQKMKQVNVSKLSESIFLEGNAFSAIVLLWGCSALLIFLAYIAGTHLVTYNPVIGVSKQVGLFWSPNWTLDKLFWLPAMVMVASVTLRRWKDEWRPSLLSGGARLRSNIKWQDRIEAHSVSFRATLCICVVIIFLLQWYGAYLLPLMENRTGDRVVDWLLVAIERPDVISISKAVLISALANLLSGVTYWFLFAGLLLLYIIATDFGGVCRDCACHCASEFREKAVGIGRNIVWGIYCFTVLAVLTSTQIKLVAVYLMTDSENLVAWLFGDASIFLGLNSYEWDWFDKSPSASITSFFVLFIPCFVFFVCLSVIYSALDRLELDASMARLHRIWLGHIAVITLLIVNFWSLGQFSGFSILLLISVLVALYSLLDRGLSVRFRAGTTGRHI